MACDYCDGSGYLYKKMEITGKFGTTELEVSRSLCVCLKWQQISDHYKNLKYELPSQKDLTFFKKNLLPFKFVIFSLTNKITFYEIVKQRLLFSDFPYNKKLIATSNEIVETYYLPRDDFSEGRISDTSNFDFIFLTLDSGILRPSAPRVIAELIEYRLLYKLPLWVSTINMRITQTPEFIDTMKDYEKYFAYYSPDKKSFVKFVTKQDELSTNDKIARS